MNIMNTEATITFRGLPWFRLASSTYITIGGAGGIGSWLSLFLTRAGFPCSVHDFDIVEARNIGGQFYGKDAIGKKKVEALKQSIGYFSDSSRVSIYVDTMDINSKVSYNCFSAFDNMKARKEVFMAWKSKIDKLPQNEAYKAIFIDGRLEAEFFQIYCVTPSRIKRYEETLFEDADVAETACSVKQTSHVAAMIGSFMTTFFTNHLTNIVEGMKVREVPFKYEVFLPLIKTYEE